MEQSDPPTRALTLDEAIEFAILLQKNDQLAEAEVLYQRVFEVAPGRPDALHYAGILAHQQGRTDEGIALIERSLAVAPEGADGYSNLGVLLQAAGRLPAAIQACERAIALDPRHANAHSNLGVALKASGRSSEAEAAYRRAIELDPSHIDAYTNLGILLNGLGRTAEAAACYCKVITLRPQHREARRLLALAHCTLGDIGEAIGIFDEWLHEEPDDPIARHMRAACSGQDVPARASNPFVEQTFDRFASSFESKLAQLSYRAPALVAALLEDTDRKPRNELDVLDAGCGTGLCGPLVARYARRLVGVDLSACMLAHAAEKQVYAELAQAELTEYLSTHPDAFDVIVSADALVYFGSLDEAFVAAAGALRPNGLFIFTLERAADAEIDIGYHLEFHGRYSHAAAYVARALTLAGLQPDVHFAELRMESGVPVAGLVIRAIKRAHG